LYCYKVTGNDKAKEERSLLPHLNINTHEGAKSRSNTIAHIERGFLVCASRHWQVPVEDAERAEHVRRALGKVRREAEEAYEGDAVE